ncbi:MAG: LON peptidase substrate-binding domain-containing protein, partial [Candidatus Kryptoniota bacterium]
MENDLEAEDIKNIPTRLPVLPMRDTVVLPYMLFPVLVGREQSVRAVGIASKANKYILLLPQKNSLVEDPGQEDLYKVGTAARILQILQLPNGLFKVLVDGLAQVFVRKFSEVHGVLYADFQMNFKKEKISNYLEAHIKHASQLFREYIENSVDIPPETWMSFDSIREIDRRLYYAVAHLDLSLDQKVALYELKDLKAQYSELIRILAKEVEVLKIEREIDEKVQGSIQKNQRKYYLQEQLRIMQDELGEDGDYGEYGVLKDKIVKAKMPEQVRVKALEELDRLKRTQPYSPESTVTRNYLEWLVSVPWFKKTVDNVDVQHARQILDEDHYGLDKPKERIVEQIAVLNLVKEMHSQILCFVGPPGVGKTSLAKSIARALGRQFVRISLGGMRDEAEIRGHRRTYVGSLPGRIIQAMKRAGVVNPVILLDEIDKMTLDFHGDPASALLEVLDPEQNRAFQDNYLEVDYDLSKVLFITTANIRDNIPPAL